MRQAPDDNGDLRNVIVFRLRPSGDVEHDAKDDIPPAEETKTTLVSADVATNAVVESEDNLETDGTRSVQAKTETERREAVLLRRFRAYLQRRGHVLKRHQIKIKGEASTLQTDLYDVTDHVLYEAKGNTSREAVRMAVGQLHDFRRHVEPPTPESPFSCPANRATRTLRTTFPMPASPSSISMATHSLATFCLSSRDCRPRGTSSRVDVKVQTGPRPARRVQHRTRTGHQSVHSRLPKLVGTEFLTFVPLLN